MSRTTLLSLGVAATVVLALVIALLVPWGGSVPTERTADQAAGQATVQAAASVAARPDSTRLSPTAEVTFVEFLDYECGACRAVYPVVEQLRAEYGDRVSFVIRSFPLPGHVNGERAARAVEAAGRQDRLEAMYQRMYETHEEWADRQEPMDERFRGYAADLGLDLVQFDLDYASPETLQRIRADQADGLALGVEGTPTFFLNGARLEPRSVADLTGALDAALADAGATR